MLVGVVGRTETDGSTVVIGATDGTTDDDEMAVYTRRNGSCVFVNTYLREKENRDQINENVGGKGMIPVNGYQRAELTGW